MTAMFTGPGSMTRKIVHIIYRPVSANMKPLHGTKGSPMNSAAIPPTRNSATKVVVASFAGNALEWYDFFLYGTAAALVFNELFFPGASPVIGTLAALATHAVGFAARPLGGIIFGHFGDRVGRKKILVTTLTLMGLSTFLIGLLPTYAQIGMWAPILLVLLRVIQGAAVGGEWGGGVLLISENVMHERRGFFSAFSQTGVTAGQVLSSAVFLSVTVLPHDQFMAWGWRIPFVLGIIITGVGLAVRSRIDETSDFKKTRQESGRSKLPVWEVIRTQPREILVAMGARMAENGSSYVFLVFALSYGKQIGITGNTVLFAVMVAGFIEAFAMVGFGALSDRIGRRPVYLVGALSVIFFAFPFFWLIDTRIPVLVFVALIIANAVGHGAMIGTQPSFFTELFGARVRYSGMSLGHELASVLAGGLSPVIATALFAWSGSSWPVALYLIGLGLITTVAVLAAKEPRQQASETHPEPTKE